MLFRAQGDDLLESGGIAGDGLRCIALEYTREDKPRFQLCERHADASARAAPEREICPRRNLLFVRRVPALWFERLCVPPDSRQAMYDPLAQNDQRANRQAHTV